MENLNQLAPATLQWSTNILMAVLILIVGYWIAGWVGRLITGMGSRFEQLDSTLFRFLGSLGRYAILAFTIIGHIPWPHYPCQRRPG